VCSRTPNTPKSFGQVFLTYIFKEEKHQENMNNCKRASNRRGVSPVIATTLLITITIILAIIVFIWAKSFIGEAVEKNGERAENSCELVTFDVNARMGAGGEEDLTNLYLDITNRGNVPIYSAEVRKKSLGSIRFAGSPVQGIDATISTGQVETIEIAPQGDIEAGDEIVVIPIILGEEGNTRVAFPCSEEQGVSTTIN